ncbi:hypothetical protein [Metapseudomonas resinovorans]|uniref:Phage abortive infection protein n=1 Tax=Metapseudomonas resinovorans NBRC 106553 TaxID=1245471 RepID=S6APQ5_METRE|nr:hypothetical protein [Pseudomonas resinovorans]BAN47678.1 hypothetical protein PCA10_19460 [Pseudomonas resinovorans NBRC 106553]
MESKRTWIWAGLGVLVLATLVTALPWIGNFHNHLWSDDPAHWGQFGDYIGGTLATILAALSFGGLMLNVIQQNQAMRKEWQLRDDESYVKQAVVCLERAFSKVRPNPNRSFPLRSRLLWLECARLILTAESMANNIKTAGFKAMYESEREHWRGQFRNLFDPENEMFLVSNLPTYFEKGKYGDEALEHNSVYVIYEFMTWQDEQPDPIKTIDYKWNLKRILHGYRGAREYLHKFDKSLKD